MYRLSKKKVTLTQKKKNNNIKKKKKIKKRTDIKLTSRYAKHVVSKNVKTPNQSRNDFILYIGLRLVVFRNQCFLAGCLEMPTPKYIEEFYPDFLAPAL